MSTPYRKLSTGRTEKRSRKVFCLWLFFVVASVELGENQYSTEWVDRKHSSSIWGSFCLQVDFHSVFRLILILSSDWCMQPHPPHRPVIVWTRRKQYSTEIQQVLELNYNNDEIYIIKKTPTHILAPEIWNNFCFCFVFLAEYQLKQFLLP